MKILALDLARKTGVAFGDSSCARPQSLSLELYKAGVGNYYDGASRLGCHVSEWIQVMDPDVIAVEDIMDPSAQHSRDVIVSGILYQGAVFGVAGDFGVPVHRINVASARKHLCGRATAHPPRRPGSPPKSKAQIDRERADTKMMVWIRCRALGYVGHGDTVDFDRSDALCIWDYAVSTIARASRPLILREAAAW